MTPGETVVNAAPSRLPSNVPSKMTGPNENMAEVERDTAAGTDSKNVSGVGIETIHCAVAGVGSALPATSVARTNKLCMPSASAVSSKYCGHET